MKMLKEISRKGEEEKRGVEKERRGKMKKNLFITHIVTGVTVITFLVSSVVAFPGNSFSQDTLRPVSVHSVPVLNRDIVQQLQAGTGAVEAASIKAASAGDLRAIPYKTSAKNFSGIVSAVSYGSLTESQIAEVVNLCVTITGKDKFDIAYPEKKGPKLTRGEFELLQDSIRVWLEELSFSALNSIRGEQIYIKVTYNMHNISEHKPGRFEYNRRLLNPSKGERFQRQKFLNLLTWQDGYHYLNPNTNQYEILSAAIEYLKRADKHDILEATIKTLDPETENGIYNPGLLDILKKIRTNPTVTVDADIRQYLLSCGVLIFDVDKTLAAREQLFDKPTRETIIRLLREGMKIVIITGQEFDIQFPRLVEDRKKGGEAKEDALPIPKDLLRNLVIYANEGTQKYCFDEKGDWHEDRTYHKGFLTEKDIKQLSREGGQPLAQDKIKAEDESKKDRVKGVIEGVINDIKACSEIEGLKSLFAADGAGIEMPKSLSDEDLKDILATVQSQEYLCEDRDTQLAFKYSFAGDKGKVEAKRGLIAALIDYRLKSPSDGQTVLDGLEVTISGSTTIGIKQEGIDKAVSARDTLKHFSLPPTAAIYFGDEFPGNDMAVTEVEGLNIISVNANPHRTPRGVLWGDSGPEATRTILNVILSIFEYSNRTMQAAPVINMLLEKLSPTSKGAYFFVADTIMKDGKIDNNTLLEISRLLQQEFYINIITREKIALGKKIVKSIMRKFNNIPPDKRPVGSLTRWIQNLVIYSDNGSKKYSFDQYGNMHRDYAFNPEDEDSGLRKHAVEDRLNELGLEPSDAIYFGNAFMANERDSKVADMPNLVVVSVAASFPDAPNNVIYSDGSPDIAIKSIGFCAEMLERMSKFTPQGQYSALRLLADDLFAKEALRVLSDRSITVENVWEKVSALLDKESLGYLGRILGERAITPLRELLEEIQSEVYVDYTRLYGIRKKLNRALELITSSKSYTDLLSVYNYDRAVLVEVIDRAMSSAELTLKEAVEGGSSKDDENMFLKAFEQLEEPLPWNKPQAFLFVGGTGGNFLAGTLPFSEIFELEEKGFRVVMGISPHDDGGSSRKIQDQLCPVVGYFPSPGDTINIYSSLLHPAKRMFLRSRFSAEQEGSLRDNFLFFLNKITRLSQPINISEVKTGGLKIFDVDTIFYRMIYDKSLGVYRVTNLADSRDSIEVKVDEAKGYSDEFTLNNYKYRIKVIDNRTMLIPELALNVDWLFFANSALRLADFLDREYVKTPDNNYPLSIQKGSIGNFVMVGNNLEQGTYGEKRPSADPEKYREALLKLSDTLGVTNGFVIPSTFEQGTLYVLLKKMGIKIGDKQEMIGQRGRRQIVNSIKIGEPGNQTDLSYEIRRRNDEKIEIDINGYKMIATETFGKDIIRDPKIGPVSKTVLEMPLLKQKGPKYELGFRQGNTKLTVVLGSRGKNKVVAVVAAPDSKTGKMIEKRLDKNLGDEMILSVDQKKAHPGTARVLVKPDDAGNPVAHLTLDTMGQGTAVNLEGTEILFKSRLIIEQTNITESFHISPVEKLGFIDRAQPQPNPELVKMINETEDIFVMGPGSVCTSLLPVFLVPENVNALVRRRNKGMPSLFVVNPFKDNETVDYTVSDVIKLIEKVSGRKFEEMFSHMLINRVPDPSKMERELLRLVAQGDITVERIEQREKEINEAKLIKNLMDEIKFKKIDVTKTRSSDDFSKLAKMARGALTATSAEIKKWGRRGITVYYRSIATLVYREVRKAGTAGRELAVGYDSKGIAGIIDDILFEKAKALPEYATLTRRHRGHTEELDKTISQFRRRTGISYRRAIEELCTWSHPGQAEVGEFPRLIISNVVYTLLTGMDTVIRQETAGLINEYLRRGGKLIVMSGIGLGQMKEWIFNHLDKNLLHKVIAAPYSGLCAYGFTENGNLRREPYYDLSTEYRPMLDKKWEPLIQETYELFDLDKPLNNLVPGEKPIDPEKVDIQNRYLPLNKRSDDKGIRHYYFTYRLHRRIDLGEALMRSIIEKFLKRPQVRKVFLKLAELDEGGPGTDKKLMEFMLDSSRAQNGLYDLKALVGMYLQYRLTEEIGTFDDGRSIIVADYQHTLHDVNIHLNISRGVFVETMLANEKIREFIGDIDESEILITGRGHEHTLNALPRARSIIFEMRERKDLPNNVSIHRGAFGALGFEDYLSKMLQQPPAGPKSSSAGTMLDTAKIESLNQEALDRAIAFNEGILKDVYLQSKLAAEVSKIAKPGNTIAINDATMPESQKAVINEIYDKNSPLLKELERITGSTIRLLSQLDKQEGELIIISHEKLPQYDKAKYLMVKETEVYLPLAPLVAIAKLLIGAEDKTAEELKDILNTNDLYRSIFGCPANEKIIQNFIDTGIFELPTVKMVDYDELEQLQRQALAALIAA